MEVTALKPHEIARIEIETWRGHCLDVFAKGERVVGQTLESLRLSAKGATTIKLRHLAGQRADDLAKHISDSGISAKQAKSVASALASWREFEERRNYLAHAVSTVTLDAKGGWFVLFDMTVYRSDQGAAQRWALGATEAAQFAHQLEASGKHLSAQLGQVRARAGGL